MPGNGLGAEITGAVSSALNSSAPSFNGKTVCFSLMLAPYLGDAPPQNIREDAAAFFYPFGVFYRKTPSSVEAAVPEDMREQIETRKKEESLLSSTPIAAPTALLANPADGAVTLVWDAPRDGRISGYEVRWKGEQGLEWQKSSIPSQTRWTVSKLKNGESYSFQVRTLAGDQTSTWTQPATCIPGSVEEVMVAQTASTIPLRTLMRLVYYGLVQGIVTKWLHRKR
jgi:hypothetical protein